VNLAIVVGIGAALGLLSALGIYFDGNVKSKPAIVAAGSLRGVLVALLTGWAVASHRGWIDAGALGGLFGALFGITICLSKGEAALSHAKYILPPSVLSGVLSGILIVWLAF
jgi:hypothetical protein